MRYWLPLLLLIHYVVVVIAVGIADDAVVPLGYFGFLSIVLFQNFLFTEITFEMASFAPNTLAALCMLSKTTCNVMTPMVLSFYNTLNGDTAKLKADKSVFTIADGLVQHLLVNHLFRDKFKAVVGEEDETNVNISTKP